MVHSIITNCTSRKRDTGVDPVTPQISAAVSLNKSVSAWVERVKRSPVRVSAVDLYQGRSIAESRFSSGLIEADFFVLSAGLGLVPAKDLIPNYSLTIATGTGSIQNWLTAKKRSSTDW